jgi:hypothetical protein
MQFRGGKAAKVSAPELVDRGGVPACEKAGGAEQLQQVPSSGQTRPSALTLVSHFDWFILVCG